MKFRRAKVDPEQKAAQIKAKYQAKQAKQGLFTPAQEALMDELGLTPGAEKKINEKPIKKKRSDIQKAHDRMTVRQRKLAKELGLLKDLPEDID
jgi:DNA gyrase/topoisomerase IV subunit B